MLLPYPGGKTRIAKTIVSIIKNHLTQVGWHIEYREPFFGAGAVGFRLLRECPELWRIWINDCDPAISCVWESVMRRPQELQALLRDFVPCVDNYYMCKEELDRVKTISDVEDRTIVAFMKVAIHRMSFCGKGTRSSGPLGGRLQAGQLCVGDNYRLPGLIKSIVKATALLNSVATHPDGCSCLDFETVIRAPGDALIYLDPPYYEQGRDLYDYGFTIDDHYRLAAVLREEGRPWLLSYVCHPVIEALYRDWSNIFTVSVPYSMHKKCRHPEYLISSQSVGIFPGLEEQTEDYALCA